MSLRLSTNQLQAAREAERLLHEALKEKHVPSLKALEQKGGPELDYFIQLPKRSVWEEQLNFEDW